jgi:hypothetical protein
LIKVSSAGFVKQKKAEEDGTVCLINMPTSSPFWSNEFGPGYSLKINWIFWSVRIRVKEYTSDVSAVFQYVLLRAPLADCEEEEEDGGENCSNQFCRMRNLALVDTHCSGQVVQGACPSSIGIYVYLWLEKKAPMCCQKVAVKNHPKKIGSYFCYFCKRKKCFAKIQKENYRYNPNFEAQQSYHFAHLSLSGRMYTHIEFNY